MSCTINFSLNNIFKCCIACFVIAQITSCGNGIESRAANDSDTTKHKNIYADLLRDDWSAPDTNSLGNTDVENLIRYGRRLIVNTGYYFGPHGIISKNSNGMNCQNCHLDAGTKLWANSFSAVWANYPKVRARSGKLEYLERRINDCFERSMNGKKLDSLSHEMRAMVAYINWVGKDVPKDSVPEGASVADLKYPDREADSAKGKIVYETHCVSCHAKNGEGQLTPDGLYLYPPLWGDHSFNVSAGMYRISRLAAFAKSNMPNLKSTHDNPTLTDEQAWDVAAYINSQPRPEVLFKGDWPDIAKKPVDHPFGPYADMFTEHQHKYGPFQPIKDLQKKNQVIARK
jgi:thiosulfate dehydrogenase